MTSIGWLPSPDTDGNCHSPACGRWYRDFAAVADDWNPSTLAYETKEFIPENDPQIATDFDPEIVTGDVEILGGLIETDPCGASLTAPRIQAGGMIRVWGPPSGCSAPEISPPDEDIEIAGPAGFFEERYGPCPTGDGIFGHLSNSEWSDLDLAAYGITAADLPADVPLQDPPDPDDCASNYYIDANPEFADGTGWQYNNNWDPCNL